MRPSSRSQSAATTALTAGIGELFRVKRLREIPQWWILGRCLPITSLGFTQKQDDEAKANAWLDANADGCPLPSQVLAS